MPGVPTPEPITKAFGADAGAGYITDPIPVDSQITVKNGAASFTDGFPPLTMTDPTAGGVPPFGQDMNGILKMISAYCAAIQAGQFCTFNATVAAAIGGYAVGAILAKADGSGTWRNTVAGNTANPDTGGAGWVSSTPLYSNAALAGPNDVVLPGVSDYLIDVSTASGAVSFSGFIAQRDGQRVTLRAVGANNLTLDALTGSAAANQISMSANLAIVPNDTVTIQYSQGAGKWFVV